MSQKAGISVCCVDGVITTYCPSHYLILGYLLLSFSHPSSKLYNGAPPLSSFLSHRLLSSTIIPVTLLALESRSDPVPSRCARCDRSTLNV
jgi:hypothetical protein